MHIHEDVRSEASDTCFSACYGNAKVMLGGKNRVIIVNDREVRVSPREYAFLLLLAQGRGKVITQRMAVKALYEDSQTLDLKILDVYVCNLRRILRFVHPDAVHVVRSVWGRGYSFGEPLGVTVPIPAELVADLPRPRTRWVSSRKNAVCNAIQKGLATREQILSFYPDLSEGEFEEWLDILKRFGKPGLRATRTQIFRL